MTVDRNVIIDAMSQVKARPNDAGLIPAFNVLVTSAPCSLWSNFADLITNSVQADLRPAAEALLVNAAHECGYHTGYGIITSEEWDAICSSMIEGPEDVLHAAYAVFTAWGWAKSEIVELIPGERMVVRAYDYYESDVVDRGALNGPCAYMIQGVCAAFMDLAYGGPYDSTGKTGLRTFKCEQVRAIECGDEFGEFVVTRA
jgi:hypothetical protein